MTPREPWIVRISFAAVRLFSALVPARSRREWRLEWEAEIRHRREVLDARHAADWRHQMDLFRRVLGALPDAAWLRRQFTADADIVHDLRHGVRMLRKSPAFALSAIAILALGIGGTVSVVTLLDTLMFRPLPYADADRIVTLWQRSAARATELDQVAPANFIDWRERSRSFSAMAAVEPYSYDYTGSGEPQVLFGARVTAGFWEAIGISPALGRTFDAAEYAAGGRHVAIISHAAWQQVFAGDPRIVGRTVTLDGDVWTIVGVLPRAFAPQLLDRPWDLAVWVPKVTEEHEKRTRGSAWWNVVARLGPGVSREQAQAEMDAISVAMASEYPSTNEGMTAAVVFMRDHLMGDVRLSLLVMLGAVVLVLGIGCANVASLLLARGREREREFAIRAALGAGRTRLVRQLVAESLLLSIVAACTGTALAVWGVGAIVALAPAGLLRLHEAAIDGRALAFAAVLTTLTTIAFGLLPAIQFSRPSADAMRDRTGGAPRRTFRRALVTAEVAFALVLLTGAGLLIRSFGRLVSVDPGFSARNVVALQVFAWERNTTPDRLRNFYAATIERIRSLPGVDAAGAVSAMPFITANIDIRGGLEVVGRAALSDRERRVANITIATPGYFSAMSIPIRAGRVFDDRDGSAAPRVAVVTDALRRREWPTEDPVGRRIRVQWQGRPLEAEVVGVVGQLRHDGLDRAPRAEVFLPHAQVPFGSMTYVVRATGDPAAVISAAKKAVWDVDPLQAFYDTEPVGALVRASLVRQRFSMTLMSAFACMALVLCATGIYGVVSFTTAQRTREIGVRMALGADRAAILTMVLREGTALVAAGVGSGLVGALALSQVLRTLLFEVRPTDPVTFGTVCLVLAAVGLAACYVPARRATRVDPVVALRVE